MRKLMRKVNDHIVLVNVIPSLICEMLFILIFSGGSLFELLFCTFGLPIWLLIRNYVWQQRKGSTSFALSFILITMSCIMLHAMSYANWGISTGGLVSPDSETVLIVKDSMELTGAIIVFGSIVAKVMLLGHAKRNNNIRTTHR